MANNKPFQNPDYDRKLDFFQLALQDKDFSEILSSNGGSFDFKKPEHVLQLTKSLLKRDFGLKLKLPSDRLCPAIPIRKDYSNGHDPSRSVLGIDIGVGSSCIYPLLGCTARSNWKFIGTEIDEKNYNHAVYNVTNNDLDKRVRLAKTLSDGPLFPLNKLMVDKADFTMCNPPFFASKQEMMSTYEKATEPSTACTGFEVEMVTDGGESQYVSRMVDESKVLGERFQWYTSQLGKLASLPIIIDKLKALGCKNWAVGVLNPHEKTRRWVLGWSWAALRPKNDIARIKDLSVSQVWPTEYPILIPKHTKNALADTVNSTLDTLSLDWSFDPKTSTGLGVARGNVWSRHARRKRKLQEMSAETPSSSNPVPNEKNVTDLSRSTAAMEPEMIFRVSISDDLVSLRWLKGVDDVLWDSFCGMMRRKLTDNVPTVKKKTKGKGIGGIKDEGLKAEGQAGAMDEGE